MERPTEREVGSVEVGFVGKWKKAIFGGEEVRRSVIIDN